MSDVLVTITPTEWDGGTAPEVLRLSVLGTVVGNDHYAPRIMSDITYIMSARCHFWGRSGDFGWGHIDVSLADQDAVITDFALRCVRADVTISDDNFFRTYHCQARSIDIMDGGNVRVRLGSRSDDGLQSNVNSSVSGSFADEQVKGLPIPVAWGRYLSATLLPTLCLNTTQQLYLFSDARIIDTPSTNRRPYDNHVGIGTGSITLLESVPFTPGAGGGFVLSNMPAGKVTFFTSSFACFIDDEGDQELRGTVRLARRACVLTGVDYSLDSLTSQWGPIVPINTYPCIHSTGYITCQEVLDRIAQGIGGVTYIDIDGVLQFSRLIAPENEPASDQYTDTDLIGNISIRTDDAPGLTNSVRYAHNPGHLSEAEAAGESDLGVKTRIMMPHREYRRADPPSVYYQQAESADPIDWWGNGADTTGSFAVVPHQAMIDEVDRWHEELYPFIRRFYSFTVPINRAPGIGDVVSIQSDTMEMLLNPRNLYVAEVRLRFVDGLADVRAWG